MKTTTPKGFNVFEGDLYKDGEYKTPTRVGYARQTTWIEKPRELAACLRAGQFTFPGGYEVYFLCQDGEVLSFEAVLAEFKHCAHAIHTSDRHSGWRVIACDATCNTDAELVCSHTGRVIQPAWDAETPNP